MKNLVIEEPSQLEQDLMSLHTGTPSSKEFFKQTLLTILQSQTISSFIKADKIAEVFTSLDVKIEYIKEQQRLLASLKKQLDQAKGYAKVEVSEALSSLGVTKIEGLTISSITATKATTKSVTKLEILNEDELFSRGYYKIELDHEAIEKALVSTDKKEDVGEFAKMSIESITKPATIRINKRKTLATDELVSIAA